MWLLDTNALIKFKKEKFKIESSSYNLYTTIFNIIEFPPSLNFDFLVILYPKLQTFEKALNYSVYLREKGTPLSIIDILIATIAVENNLKIVLMTKILIF